jgi:hypothetical protein
MHKLMGRENRIGGCHWLIVASVIGTIAELVRHTFLCTLACAGFFCPALLFGYLMLELPSDTVPLFVAALVCSLEKKKRKKKFIYSIHRVYLRISSEHMCIYICIYGDVSHVHTHET